MKFTFKNYFRQFTFVDWAMFILGIIVLFFTVVIFTKPAKANSESKVQELNVTDHSKYIIDHRFGGLCWYETSSSVGIYVNKVEEGACRRMIKGVE